LAFLRNYLKAVRYIRTMATNGVNRIFVFSYSRSGTHNFYTRFHYSKSVFAIKENLFHGQQNPYQVKTKPWDLKPRHVLGLSTFGVHGLQDKQGEDLTHLFFLNNYYLRDSYPLDITEVKGSGDKFLFYLRNFFRVIYSRDRALRRKGRTAAPIDDETLESKFRQHRRKLNEMLSIHDLYPKTTAFYFHELFCAQPEETLHSVCDFIRLPKDQLACWNRPHKFFRICFASNIPPELKGDKLWCPERKQFILGTGGKYNPVPEPSLARTLGDNIHEMFTPRMISRAEAIFGKTLVSFWLNDATYPYGLATRAELLDIIRESLASCT
jgi:hypothetical protein